MKTEELRIGNYVDFEFGEVEDRRCGFEEKIDDATCLLYLEDGKYKATPIPLTEEWLIKLGFSLCNENTNKYMVNNRSGDPAFFYYKKHTQLRYMSTYVQYVHQLQNLYFALTNSELNIK